MIFVTGGTGFLGQQIIGRLLVSRPNDELALLVRPSSFMSAEKRVEYLLTGLFGESNIAHYVPRVRVVEGDLTAERFGLGASEFDELAQSTQTIFHSGASTTLNLPLDQARQINVQGTENVLQLSRAAASRNHAFRLHHISTAYVAGDTTAIIQPYHLDPAANFRNSYERTKAEAEALVRAAGIHFPVTIYRPSVIVGDSVTGQTSAFNVLYIPAKFIIRGIFKALPGVPDTPFDIVPVDYVADAIVKLSEQSHLSGSCFHVCVGVGRESSPKEILDLIIHTFNLYREKGLKLLPKPHFITPEISALAHASFSAAYTSVRYLEKIFHRRLELWAHTLPFVPYLTRNPQFDTSETLSVLGNTLLPPPLFPSYAERVFRYCLETNWGKLPWTNPGNLPPWFYRTSAA